MAIKLSYFLYLLRDFEKGSLKKFNNKIKIKLRIVITIRIVNLNSTFKHVRNMGFIGFILIRQSLHKVRLNVSRFEHEN